MFFVKVNWYDFNNEKDTIENMIVCANNMTEAVEKVNSTYSYINSITIEKIVDGPCNGIIYINEDMLPTIRDLNDY